MNHPNESTALYRYFDSDGKLLYVGITKNQFDRLQAHAKNAEWFSQVKTASFQHYKSRQDALLAETKAIGTELPKFNKAGPVIDRQNLDHLLEIVNSDLTDAWHFKLGQDIASRMQKLNGFSLQNEITKIGFSLAASFEWTEDGDSRIVFCDDCQALTNTKWFQYIEEESQIIIDEYESKIL